MPWVFVLAEKEIAERAGKGSVRRRVLLWQGVEQRCAAAAKQQLVRGQARRDEQRRLWRLRARP